LLVNYEPYAEDNCFMDEETSQQHFTRKVESL